MGIGAVIGLLGEFPEAYVGVLRDINISPLRLSWACLRSWRASPS